MQFTEVNSNLSKKEFIEITKIIYKGDKNWIRPLDKDIESVFSPKENKFFRHGEAARWILKDDEGKLIGRVAAFINNKTAKGFSQPTGGMGFFECINNRDAAFALFDKCKQWLIERKMEAMDGPINFGERDRWWGLLIDGFSEPNYCMNYNPLYYRNFFESYGFKTFFEQYTFGCPVQTKLPTQYAEKAERISKSPGYSFKHLNKKNFDTFIEDFRYIYNKAWTKHEGFNPMVKEQAKSIMKKLKPVLDEKIIWFAYYNNEPVGFYIMLPELNQIFKYLNGKLDWIGKLKFIWHKWRGSCRKIVGVAYGVIPEHQGKGLEGAIVVAAVKVVQPSNRYDVFEMNWIGDFNPKMIHIAESIGAKIIKKHITYRKLFDETKEFKRAAVIQ